MPWKVQNVSEIRFAFVYQVRHLNRKIAPVCRDFGISRKTGYKWLKRYDEAPEQRLENRSRRPRRSPRRTGPDDAERVLAVRDRFGWGARKVHAYLLRHDEQPPPSLRTVGRILRRNGRVDPSPEPPEPSRPFERDEPHQLWQLDFKGPVELEGRSTVHPLSILDDHSRFCITLRPLQDHTKARLWDALWDTFGRFGLPEQILCDHEFSTGPGGPRTLSWLEANLLRLGIRALHGRAYHPQTQGKVERFHGTLDTEWLPHARRDGLQRFDDDAEAYRHTYNHLRPHEAIGDQPPVARFTPSPRARPDRLPPVQYPDGATVRKVGKVGEIAWRGCRILAGRGLVGQPVRIEQREHELAVFFLDHQIRAIPLQQMSPDRMV